MALTDKLTAIANAIREKTGGTEALSLEQMVTEIVGIQTGITPQGTISITENGTHDVTEYASAEVMVQSGDGWDAVDALIDRSIVGSIYSNVETLGSNAFYYCPKLTSVNLPYAKEVGNGVSRTAVFQGCSSLVSVNAPLATRSGSMVFKSCSSLKTVNAPLLTNIGQELFYGCSELETVSFPLVTVINGKGSFYYCRKLTSVDLPLVTTLPEQTFYHCDVLTLVDLPSVTTISSQAFAYSENFNTLVLRSEKVCTLSNVNAFNNTPFAIGGTGGTVYCPASLIEQYQQASNWSALYEGGTVTFLPIEGSEYE